MTTYAAVVLAAGKGTRMKSKTPKVLHRICGKAMVGLVVETAGLVKLDPVVVVVPEDSVAIRKSLGDSVAYATQREQLGSGHALLQARPILQDVSNVVVLSGDVPLVKAETISKLVSVHDEREACITLMTSRLTDPAGLGRVVRTDSGDITAIVEEADADEAALAIDEINGGVYCFRVPWLWDNIDRLTPSAKGEIYLTDLISMAVAQGLTVESVESRDRYETLGVNNRVQLAEAEGGLQGRIRERWMLNGVSMPDPASVYIDADVKIGMDTIVLPNTHVKGKTSIGQDCEIGPNSMIVDSRIGDACQVVASVISGSTLDEGVDVGPYSHIRPGSHLQTNVHIGNFAEVKNSKLGPETKSGHFSYIGDAELGSNVNVGAGSITCNFDGDEKHLTEIGDNAFIGSDSLLIAPVKIGPGAATGAGSIVNRTVPENSMWVGDRSSARVIPIRKRKRKK